MSMAIQKAIIYATIKHEGQKRKGTNIPYIVHPMGFAGQFNVRWVL